MRSTTAHFTEIYERLCSIPKSTSMHFVQRLREDPEIFRRGKTGRGAIEPNAAEIANWTIALCAATATTRVSPDPIETVRYARGAVRLRGTDLDRSCPTDALRGLLIEHASTFGEAIDGLFEDMRQGAYETWKGGRPAVLRLRFLNNGGRIIVEMNRFIGDRLAGAVMVFRSENPADGSPCLTLINELDGLCLEALADRLGPLDK